MVGKNTVSYWICVMDGELKIKCKHSSYWLYDHMILENLEVRNKLASVGK